MKEMKETKMSKTKIMVGFIVIEKVVEMEANITKGRIRSNIKEVLGNFQNLLEKKKFLVKFEGSPKNGGILC